MSEFTMTLEELEDERQRLATKFSHAIGQKVAVRFELHQADDKIMKQAGNLKWERGESDSIEWFQSSKMDLTGATTVFKRRNSQQEFRWVRADDMLAELREYRKD